MSTISARAFNQDVGAAKRSAEEGPVVITDRGTPTHVLLSVSDYQDLLSDRRGIVERLSVDDDIDLPTEPLKLVLRPADL